ncbi:PH domain-containing protein [Streptomyces sp. G1]|uniref:PH domain-containing protein n=1 Tax=Streptomyces sp. G1 TaxID=361572 RepID=UPI00202EB0FA|nr:PH domain-containing protein [Streptomyces sp. G1]MCM1973316.1 PH domain-containing protein [Streptomyces sp. G1]
MNQVTLPREYRPRAGSGARAFLVMGLVWAWGCYQSATADRLPPWWRVGLPVLTALFIAFVACTRPRRFTALDERGIAVRNLLRVRRLGWAELHDIRAQVWPEEARAIPGMPRVCAYAYLRDGKRIVLPCVDDREVEAVRTEVALIRSVWTVLRGPGWQPDPGAEPRIARAAVRREWWGRSAGAKVVIGTATLAGIALLVVLLG